MVRVRAMIGDATSALRKAQDRYKTDYDRRLRFRIDVRPGHSVYIDRPPSSVVPVSEHVADAPR